ncbi:MAG TPA: glycosyltransferase family 4 protein [Gemmatimonadales bacterium]|nr:glycosyltransferase family 4 protein [Gemmatimonadales bacterium]
MSGPGARRVQRVLLTTDTVGGVWTHTLELARALGAAGVEVAIATLGTLPHPDQISEARAAVGPGLHALDCRLPWMDDPWDDLVTAQAWLGDLVARAEPDVVHLSEPALAGGWATPTVAVGHSCVLSWWQAVRGEPAPEQWERYRRAMRAGLHAADAVVAPTEWMLSALRRYYGVPAGHVIPNGTDPGRFRPGAKDPLVVTATRVWDPAKNVRSLDRAAAGLSWPVFAAGDDRPPGRSQPLVLEHLRTLGRLPGPEVARWLSRAAVFALPARYEPFGLSALEAALSGCVLVLGDIPSLRETWDGVALFVPPDDDRTLRLALDALIDDPALRHMLAMRARRRALGLTAERMGRRYLELYGRLLLRAGDGRPSREVPACAS